MHLLHAIVTRTFQAGILFVLAIVIGLSSLAVITPEAPDHATPALAALIGLSTILIVLTLEFAATRILAAINDHPARFAHEIKSQRSESRAIKARG
jgi:hypothetical protein